MLTKLKNTDYEMAVNDINGGENVTITGFNIGEKGYICSDLNKPIIYVSSNINDALVIENQFSSLNINTSFSANGSLQVKYFEMEPIYTKYLHNESIKNLYNILFGLVTKKLDAVVVTSKLLNYRLPNPDIFKKNIVTIYKDGVVDITQLRKQLIKIGYQYRDIVTEQGQFSKNGDSVDIFPINSPIPYKISFFDDVVEYIKSYNIEDFLPIEEVKEISICPNTFIFIDENVDNIIKNIEKERDRMVLNPNIFTRLNNIVESVKLELLNNVASNFILPYLNDYNYNILDYVGSGTVVFDNAKYIYDSVSKNIADFVSRYIEWRKDGELLESHKDFLLPQKDVFSFKGNRVAFIDISNQNRIFDTKKLYTFKCLNLDYYSNDYNTLCNQLEDYLKRMYQVVIFGENNSTNIYDRIRQQNIPCEIIADVSQCRLTHVNIINKSLHVGVNFNKERVVLLSVGNIKEKQFTPTKNIIKVEQDSKRKAFFIPKQDDYVVHIVHGIGKCNGVEKMKFNNIEKDFIKIQYADAICYLPVEKANELSAYVSGGDIPKLNKIGGKEFETVKNKVKSSIKGMAIDLLNLYANRALNKSGYKYIINDDDYELFCKTFEYEETDDQLTAIEDILQEMKSGKVIDRLICGDVGFGKTEVALRAMYITVCNNKQVAMMCPTTILSEQHYNNCKSRLTPFGVKVEVLNKFKTPKERQRIIDELKEGKIDVIIGTTSLLSKKVEFFNLGLIVYDEEQKFGVEAKEKLKELNKVNVLTMSATPIPRTLNMSMSNIRDMSIINTPPKDRLPVQTMVVEYSDSLVKNAIERELNRGGQVLILYNKVETIYNFKNYIQSLVADDVVVNVAHGQMQEKELYNAIQKLYNKETDVMVTTTLIENGVDLPTANTLICIDSQNLGLSQLYQLRGRVGRTKSILAYAYFTYPENKIIGEDAQKRLEAIRSFSALGSGFKIAMRDLEIRGAGDILGKEQHGHIIKVGYDMYQKLLREVCEEINGNKSINTEFVDCKINIDIDIGIPENFISNSEVRFELSNAISNIYSLKDMERLTNRISGYNPNREIPQPTKNFMKLALIKNLASDKGISNVTINNFTVYLKFAKRKYMEDKWIDKSIEKLHDEYNFKVVYRKGENDGGIDFSINMLNLYEKIENCLHNVSNFVDDAFVFGMLCYQFSEDETGKGYLSAYQLYVYAQL